MNIVYIVHENHYNELSGAPLITKHYAETLNQWKVNFMKVIPEVKKMGFSEAFIKMWEFYFVFCEAGFLERNIGDVQLVFSKSGARDIDIRY